MAVTVRNLLDMALVLIDEVTETGVIASETPEYYETKAVQLMTIVQAELLPNTVNPPILSDIDDELLLSDKLAIQVGSYGLASKIALAEDMNLANTLNAMYDEYKRNIPTHVIPIVDVYEEGEDNG
jgi:hypothetical protein